MAQDAPAVPEKSQLLHNCCIAIAALCLLLYLDGLVTELRHTVVSNLAATLLGTLLSLVFIRILKT